ncbi:condensin subunit ScpA [Ruminococcaceae bacterium YRB3002]|nr:condensin subunit ScpA [Ruminococcaceae bacterium YRB3002]
MTVREHIRPNVKIQQFEGPMDLLFHLIEKNDIDIYDIPIADVTAQYLDFLAQMEELDMEVASEFLVMGATLVNIKSRMMLPKAKKEEGEEGDDPREELVISLLRYKRCRLFAEDLRKRREMYSGCSLRLPTTAKELGIEPPKEPQEFNGEEFDQAVSDICARNEVRFADISAKITHILKKDKLSVRERMKSVFQIIRRRGKMLFEELFAGKKPEKMDRIVSFMAILELLRADKITCEQERPFDSILIEEKR